MQVTPIPIRYSAFGGEGLEMATGEQQQTAMNELLTGLGVPVDFFVGSFKSEKTFVRAKHRGHRPPDRTKPRSDSPFAALADLVRRP